MLVANERREAVLQFAETKFASQGSTDEHCLLDVVKAMAKVEKSSNTFFAHLAPHEFRADPFAQRKPPRLQTMTVQDLEEHLPGMAEEKISNALSLLSADSSELVSKVSFD